MKTPSIVAVAGAMLLVGMANAAEIKGGIHAGHRRGL